MGRSGKRGKKFKHGGKKDKPRGERPDRQHVDYPVTIKTNEQYEKYYQEQGLVPESEWEDFLEALRQPLPTTFRITGFRGEAQEMLKIIKNEYISKLVSMDECPVHSIPWYPGEMAWQINLSRREIRNQQGLQVLKDFLLNETESGNISRQEAVSMIPPLVLDVKPHHKILDMCAAPGSKTAQLIELLHSDGDNVPEGYVIANDVDNKRCYLMVHQVKRLQSPCCAIVNHDATTLPNIRIGEGLKDFVQYDRVLCDVPCSGDGTLRKNVDIWNKWNTNTGPNLHKIQMKVLKRGLELLAVGGRLVYSTCSLNPIEDEAVIASMMDKCKGCIELVDVSSQLPNLKYSRGVSSWKVYNKKMEQLANYRDAIDKGYPHFEASMFPPDNAADFNLDRCIRVLPHQQNTGGFFIVAIKKTATLPWMTQNVTSEQIKPEIKTEGGEVDTTAGGDTKVDTTAGGDTKVDTTVVGDAMVETTAGGDTKVDTTVKGDVPVDTSAQGDVKVKKEEGDQTKDETNVNGKRQAGDLDEAPPTKHKRMHGYKEDPFLFLKSNDKFWEPIQKFYGIRGDFPVEQVMYRAEHGQKRTIYFVSSQLRNIVLRNSDRIRFINLGLRIFGRSSSPLVPDCDFRISQEGLTVLGTECITRSVQLSREDMITFITYDNPYFANMSPTARDALKNFKPGCLLMTYKPEEGETKPSCGITVCGWRGKSSIRSFLSKNLRAHYLRLFGLELNEILKILEKESKEKNQETENDDKADCADQVTDDKADSADHVTDDKTDGADHVTDDLSSDTRT